MTGTRSRLLRPLSLLRVRMAILGVLAVLAAVEITSWVLRIQAEKHLLAERWQLEVAETTRTAGLMDDRVRSQLESAEISLQALDPGIMGDVDRLDSFLRSRPLLRSRFDAMFFADASGRMLLLHDQDGSHHPSLNVSEREFFKRAMVERIPVISQPMTSRISEQTVVIFAFPVLDQGRAVGIAGASLRLHTHPLLADVREPDSADAHTLIAITDRAGTILAHPNAELIGQHADAGPRLGPAWRTFDGQPDRAIGQVREIAGRDTLAVVADIRTSRWLLWRLQERAAVLAPLEHARVEAHWATAAVMLFSAPLLLGVLWWQLRPLARLQQRAERMFEPGIDPADGWPTQGGEIGDLRDSLRRIGIERIRLERANERSLRQLRTLMDAAPMALLLVRDGAIEMANPMAFRLLGHAPSELVGQPASTIHADPERYLEMETAITASFSDRSVFSGDMQLLRKDGSPFWARLRGQPMDWSDESAGTIWTLEDISDQLAQGAALQWAATHDPLTSLGNRSLLQARLDAAVRHRNDGRSRHLLLLDLDRFKPINDEAGHAAGDQMLAAVAQVLMQCVRGTDTVCRTGGDEFAVLLEDCPDSVAGLVAEDIAQRVAAIQLPWHGRVLSVGVSIGLATLDGATGDAAHWNERADAACYAAKAAGRGQVRKAPLIDNASIRAGAHDERRETSPSEAANEASEA